MKIKLSFMKKTALVIIFAVFVMLYGCNNTVKVTDLQVDKTSVSLAIDEEVKVTVTVLPDNAVDKILTWISENPEIATVTNGMIKGVNEGTTKVTVSIGDIAVTVNVTVNIPKVTLTFNTDGGNNIPSQEITKGGSMTIPQSPTKHGHTFVGWFKENLNDEFDFDVAINENMTAYAKWEPLTYHVIFEVDGNKIDDKGIKYGQKVTKPVTDPVKNRYAFIGWFDGDAEFNFNNPITGDITLVAKFVKTSSEFTVELDYQGGNSNYQSKAELVADFLVDYNKALSKSDTLEKIASYENWSPIDFHQFFLHPDYREKWAWLPAYLGVVGSATNKKACADIGKVTTVSAFVALNPNHVYALTYEVRAFLLDSKYTKNANWMSADYSDMELGHGFWPYYVAAKEQTKFDLNSPFTLPTTLYKEGHIFAGWYTNPEFTGEPVTVVNDDVKVYAKWNIKDPVTEINVKNTTTTLQKLATLQLEYEILPANAFNKKVEFITSDEKILKVSATGLVTACNVGSATITVRSVITGVTGTITITILPEDDITVVYNNEFNGTLYPNAEAQLTVAGLGVYKDKTFAYKSSNTSVLTVDSTGKIKGVAKGTATVEISENNKALLTVTISVIEELTAERVDKLLDLLIKANRPVVDTINASLYYDGYSAFQQYYDSVYSSVNYFLFDSLNLDATTYLIDPVTNKDKHGGLKSSTEFITVHDTANISGGLTSHGDYWRRTDHDTSIHFTVGDGGVVQSLDTKYVAFHAGDGTSTTFKWNDSGVKATGTGKPVFDIDAEGYFTINGTKSTIKAPTKSGQILDSSYFSNLGPSWTIGENGNYHLGTMYLATSQVTRGIISSFGGNLNSTGIEMCVNTNGNIYDTWQRTAKLIGKLLIDHELDTTRVYQHNNFSGKNCPQSLIMSNYWDSFMKIVEFEYAIQSQFSDATITMVSNNPTIVNNKGLVITNPKTSTAVSYTVTVKIGSTTKSVTLGSVIPGTSSWMQLDGFYATR